MNLMRVLPLFYNPFLTLQGVLFHPYKTFREIAREHRWYWVAFPSLLWIFGFLIWRMLFLFGVLRFGYAMSWIFLSLWFTIYCSMYQVFVLYLLVRFGDVKLQMMLRKKGKHEGAKI
ncbi:MAG TPA: hypothetical protein DCW55_00980 [Candidatus Pacebacteria bacterium]|nr:hypothetical protein [Candidatus Paceibacterota bacterium]